MVSAEQSIQITKCGSPIWGWGSTTWSEIPVGDVLERPLALSSPGLLVPLKVPKLHCGRVEPGLHGSCFLDWWLSTCCLRAASGPRPLSPQHIEIMQYVT